MKKEKPTSPAKINLKNIKSFIEGWIRYIIWYLLKRSSLLRKVEDSITLLSKHKKEQFEWRLRVMNQECLKQGSCKVCGCQTPQLQMSDKACDGNCYPEMMNAEDWEKYKTLNKIIC